MIISFRTSGLEVSVTEMAQPLNGPIIFCCGKVPDKLPLAGLLTLNNLARIPIYPQPQPSTLRQLGNGSKTLSLRNELMNPFKPCEL